MGSFVYMFVSYNGSWEIVGTKWMFKNALCTVIPMENNVSYLQLIDTLHKELRVDKELYGLKLEVPYTCGDQPFAPVLVESDLGVRAFLGVTSQERIPLCVTPVKKTVTVERNRVQVSQRDHDATNPVDIPYECDPYVNDDPIADYEGSGGDSDRVPSENNWQIDQVSIGHEITIRRPANVPMEETPGTSSSRPGGTQDKGKVPIFSTDEHSKWHAPMFTKEDIAASSRSEHCSSGAPWGELYIGKTFENKQDLRTKTYLFAIKNNFEFMVKKSGTDVWYVTCKDPDCGWKLRGKKLARSSVFEITVYNSVHTCSLDIREKDNRQAAPWVVGHLIKKKFATDGTGYMPNSIRVDMKKDYGVNMSYMKAWRCREKALGYVRGTPEDSYSKLPSYLHMLQQKNPGTITDFVTEDGRFLYCFFSLGACIRGFRSCRPVICVDGTFLKSRYKGHMLCAVALDADSALYPLAFALVDSENQNSWKYFMLKLKEAIGDVDNLVFVSDRHASIIHAVEVVFPEAHHGACYHHVSMNVVAKFKTDHTHSEMYNAAYSYRKSKFHKHFENIKQMDPAIARYLEEIGFEKWSRPYFPGNRYNIMTSNYAESFNNKTKTARSFPVTTFVEFIRFTLQTWFAKHRQDIEDCTSRLSPKMEEDVKKSADEARFLTAHPLSQYEFHVIDPEDGECVVNLSTKSCECGMFQCIGIPCRHAVAAALERNINIYALCSPYYTREKWAGCYKDTIYPTGNEEDWIVPEDIHMQVGVPIEKQPVGRPKKTKAGRPRGRITSHGERLPVTPRKCSLCGGFGHNRATCKAR